MCVVGTHASQTTGSAQTELSVLSTEMEIPAQNVGPRVEELGSQGLYPSWPYVTLTVFFASLHFLGHYVLISNFFSSMQW